jgi:immune inhibitor A
VKEIKYSLPLVLACCLVLVCSCMLAGLGIYLTWGRAGRATQPVALATTPAAVIPTTPSPGLHGAAPIPTPSPEAGSPSSPLSPSASLTSTEYLLAKTDIPTRDRLDLAYRLKISDQPIPKVVNSTPPSYKVGDQTTFWVGEDQALRYFEVTATLRYIGSHSYWWIENGYSVPDADIAASAEKFESKIYPTDQSFFGREWIPGVDNDPHVHIFVGNVPGVGGYYYSINEYSKLINRYSNEKEMFFINIAAAAPGNDRLDSILAHEFQHMIHWYNDSDEDTWVNEGLSELAMALNGYGVGGTDQAFLRVPDTQLTTWGDAPNESIAHYGASFLFMQYFLDRFGEKALRQVVANPANGADGFNAVLAAEEQLYCFDDVFSDWVVANYLNSPTLDRGQWGYRNLSLTPVAVEATHQTYPANQAGAVSQYAADYLAFEGNGTLTIAFTGTTQVKVAPTQAHSGRYVWWSNRGDDSDTTLTRSFDLTGADQPKLQFWSWYDIENEWDFVYVEASTDGGKTWDMLPGRYSTEENKIGNNLGRGWTGNSGGGDTPQWVQEEVDLSAYAGKVIKLRFEQVTDDAVNHAGFMVDDIAIPVIGYFDDVEAGSGGWRAAGFARIDNVLPQRYVVQAVVEGDQPSVERMPLDAANDGQLTITGLGQNVKRVVLVVSGLTPFTTEVANYSYSATLTQP